MKAAMKHTLRGIGSLTDLMPRPDFRRHIPSRNTGERMKGHWQRVGDSLRRAARQFQNEQTAAKRSSEASS